MEGEGPTYKLHDHIVLLKLSFLSFKVIFGIFMDFWLANTVYAVAKFIVPD
jgi:hypothetical protein